MGNTGPHKRNIENDTHFITIGDQEPVKNSEGYTTVNNNKVGNEENDQSYGIKTWTDIKDSETSIKPDNGIDNQSCDDNDGKNENGES